MSLYSFLKKYSQEFFSGYFNFVAIPNYIYALLFSHLFCVFFCFVASVVQLERIRAKFGLQMGYASLNVRLLISETPFSDGGGIMARDEVYDFADRYAGPVATLAGPELAYQSGKQRASQAAS